MRPAFSFFSKINNPLQEADNHYDYEDLVTANNDQIKTGSQPNTDPLDDKLSEQDRLLILVKDQNSVIGTASFLERRGIETFVSTAMQDVIDRLAQGWSKYVLLSINYPHPKIDLIPTLLHQSFQAEIMVFAETSDRKTNTRLTGSKAKHIIFGAPSGPVVLMRLKQMQREVHGGPTEGDDSNARQGDAKEGDVDQQVRISGNSGGDGGAVHLKGSVRGVPQSGGPGERSDALAKLMSALKSTSVDGAEDALDQGLSALNDSFNANSKSTASGKMNDSIEQMRKSVQKPTVHIQKGIGRGTGRMVVPPPDSKQKAAVREAMKKGQVQALPAIENGPNQHHHSLFEEHPEFRKQRNAIEHTDASATFGAPPVGHDSAPQPDSIVERGVTKTDPIPTNQLDTIEHDALTDAALSSEPTSIIESCIREALLKVCGKPRDGRESLLEYRTASVVILSSPQFTGSVLIVIGRGVFDHKKTLRQVEVELLQLMSDRGIDFSIGEMQSYPVEPALSCEEAFLSAQFAAVARSEDLEVGMAYLDVVPVEPTIIETADQMLEVSCDDIEPDQILPFELYLYLPMNKKYLRYVKNGSSLSGKQSSNLKTNEVKNLYLNREAADAFKQHATVGNLKKIVSKCAA